MKPLLFLIGMTLCCATINAQPAYNVYALQCKKTAWNPAVSDIAVGAPAKDTLNGSIVFWFLKGNAGQKILIDAGILQDQPEKEYTRPDTLLARLDVKADDITDIIITHPHGDHIGGLELFKNATLWMQEEDYNYFVGRAWQKDGFSEGFNEQDVLKLVQKNLDKKLRLIKGDSLEILPGIRVFIGSKHTFQSQYVLINGSAGKTIIASDNIWFYPNLKLLLPIPKMTFDPVAYVTQMKRMKTLVSNQDLIIPGHDTEVFRKFPTVRPGIVQITTK